MLPGMLYFVSIHMVPLVPRGPVGEVYRDITEACKPNICSKQMRSGKGLSPAGDFYPRGIGPVHARGGHKNPPRDRPGRFFGSPGPPE